MTNSTSYIPPHIEKNALERLKDRSNTFYRGIDLTGEIVGRGSRDKTYRRITIEQQGNLLDVKQHVDFSSVRNSGGGMRGVITRFSRESRKRMLDNFARLDRATATKTKAILFVTLTYQRNMIDHVRAQRDLKVWWERLVERYPTAWCVWKREFQERGSIHFHLMLGNVGHLPVNVKDDDDDEWDAQLAWNEVSEQTARNSLDVEKIRSFNGVMYYAAKYMSKEVEYDNTSDDYVPIEYPIAGITKKERLREISKRGVDPCEYVLEQRERYRAAMDLPISHNCSGESGGCSPDGQNTSHSCSLGGGIGRFWGILGRKHVPYAARRTRSIVVKEKMYRWWLSIIDSSYCRMRTGFTVYTDKANTHYMQAMTAYRRYSHSDWLTDYADDVRTYFRLNTLQWQHLSTEKQKKYLYRKFMNNIYGFEFDAP